jgi:Ca2+/Na+ antiporter
LLLLLLLLLLMLLLLLFFVRYKRQQGKPKLADKHSKVQQQHLSLQQHLIAIWCGVLRICVLQG